MKVWVAAGKDSPYFGNEAKAAKNTSHNTVSQRRTTTDLIEISLLEFDPPPFPCKSGNLGYNNASL